MREKMEVVVQSNIIKIITTYPTRKIYEVRMRRFALHGNEAMSSKIKMHGHHQEVLYIFD